MIKFFRRIRQKLLSENKFSKYLLYAIGEIALVVIGILIALSINNLNESRKMHLQDIEFLKNLKTEFLIDISTLTDRKNEYQRINENIKNTITLFDSRMQTLTPEEYQEIVLGLSQLQILTPINKNIGRNDLFIAQGTLDRIDKDLNRRFITYLQNTQSINAAITKLGETLQQLNILYIHPNVDYNEINPKANRIDFSYEEIYDKKEIRNALQASFRYRNSYINDIIGQVAEAENLVILIDEKLAGAE